jgi:hypothetical protein
MSARLDSDEKSGILRRILGKARSPDLIGALSERVSPTDLQSLLLEVYNRRAASLTPADVLRQYRDNRFVKTAGISPAQTMEFDSLAFSILPQGFQPLELSPVCPLGACSALGPVDQNNVVSTIRNTEVCSDVTNVMALECASRRKEMGPEESAGIMKLCASHRLVRSQMFEDPASFAHFRILSLCTSGRDRGNFDFEVESAEEQVDYFLRLIPAAGRIGYPTKGIRVKFIVLEERMRRAVGARIMKGMAERYPEVSFSIENKSGQGGEYYKLMRFQIFVLDANGGECFAVDGGFTDWMEKLMHNRKHRYLISGMGTERFLRWFGTPDAPR